MNIGEKIREIEVVPATLPIPERETKHEPVKEPEPEIIPATPAKD